jgi:hypothetical protein
MNLPNQPVSVQQKITKLAFTIKAELDKMASPVTTQQLVSARNYRRKLVKKLRPDSVIDLSKPVI